MKNWWEDPKQREAIRKRSIITRGDRWGNGASADDCIGMRLRSDEKCTLYRQKKIPIDKHELIDELRRLIKINNAVIFEMIEHIETRL